MKQKMEAMERVQNNGAADVEIGCVETYQGREKEVIIISAGASKSPSDLA